MMENMPKEMIDELDRLVNSPAFGEKEQKSLELAQQIEKDSFDLLETGFNMGHQIYEAELSGVDNFVGLVKFFISLSATAFLASITINLPTFKSEILFWATLIILLLSFVSLVFFVMLRNNIIVQRRKDYKKLTSVLNELTEISKLRKDGIIAAANDDFDKMKYIFNQFMIINENAKKGDKK